jgi:hypothetical protein
MRSPHDGAQAAEPLYEHINHDRARHQSTHGYEGEGRTKKVHEGFEHCKGNRSKGKATGKGKSKSKGKGKYRAKGKAHQKQDDAEDWGTWRAEPHILADEASVAQSRSESRTRSGRDDKRREKKRRQQKIIPVRP